MVKPFYRSTDYEPLHDRHVRRGPIPHAVTIEGGTAAERARIMGYFQETTRERAGILHGEYLLLENCLVLADRHGVLTGGCWSHDDPCAVQSIDTYCARPETLALIDKLAAAWNTLPVVHGPLILADPYSTNYYHFALELVPRLRLLKATSRTGLLVPQSSLSRPFQRDLLSRTVGPAGIMALGFPVRVCDPVIAHDIMNTEGLLWLRHHAGIKAAPGKRRLYVRRSGRGTRSQPGGGIAETAGFLALLREHDFETIECGQGEFGAAHQAALLEGAGVILSPHGAALTNLVWLSPPLSIIEIIGAATPRACFMHLSAASGFDHHALYSPATDEAGDILVDLERLSACLQKMH